MLPKTKVEIVIENKDAKEVIAIVIKTACTETIGDGKFSSPQLTRL